MKLRGLVHKYGADVDTDAIIPARYLNTSDAAELAAHCLEGLDPGFVSRVRPGDILVASTNFGCGSSREHAPIALKAAGIGCIIAASFARIFFRNALNIGLPILECPEAANVLEAGEEVEVDLTSGEITRLSTGERFQARPFPDFMLQLVCDGGLIEHTKKKLAGGR